MALTGHVDVLVAGMVLVTDLPNWSVFEALIVKFSALSLTIMSCVERWRSGLNCVVDGQVSSPPLRNP